METVSREERVRNKDGPSRPRAVLVLGMHRSGTSCLAGSLQQRGLHLGEVYEWNRDNHKGNRENQRVMSLNDAVLIHSGGRWNKPPAGLAWTRAHAAERDRIAADLADDCTGVWGFKDPRTLLTLPFWLEGLHDVADVAMVGTFRHPAQVARSLNARGGMPFEQILALWEEHNRRLLAQHEIAPFPLVSFDLPEARYLQAVERVAKYLGLDGQGTKADGLFFESSFRTDPASCIPVVVPDALMKLYERLNAACALQEP